LRVQSKTNVAVIGAGKAQTILRASNPAYSSFIIYAGTNVLAQDFQIHVPSTDRRRSDGNSRGVYVERSSNVVIRRIKTNYTSGAGIVFYIVKDSLIEYSEVYRSWADAFHITGASQNITVQYNTTTGAGDDCYASIGYGTSLNRGISFLNNSCYGNNAEGMPGTLGGSGVSFEGTVGGKAYGNHIERTGVAGIRVATPSSYSTGFVNQIDIQNNTLVNVRTRSEIDHSAIMIYSGYERIDGINISNNKIIDPLTSKPFWVLSYGPLISNVNFTNNQFTDTLGRLVGCARLTGNVSSVVVSGNTKNGVSCNTVTK
jgi:hypothetical protein